MQQLDRFTACRTLILDHNNFTNLSSFPPMPLLETLSLAYNTLRDFNNTIVTI